MSASSALTMLNNFAIRSFVDHVASACSCRLTSMFCSHSTSIAIEPTTFCDFGGGRGRECWCVLL
jgi:hypothetical protein